MMIYLQKSEMYISNTYHTLPKNEFSELEMLWIWEYVLLELLTVIMIMSCSIYIGPVKG